MIVNQSKLEVADNSSASVVRVFKLPKNRKSAKLGDIVKGSVVSRKPSKLKSNLRKGEVVNVLILETKSGNNSL
jgi:ribosomal protein L14